MYEYHGADYSSSADNAFKGDEHITSVIIPEGIQGLGNNVFEDCSSLENVVLPGSLFVVGTECFKNCSSLKKVEFNSYPNTPMMRSNNIFGGCTNLTEILFTNADELSSDTSDKPWGAPNEDVKVTFQSGQ